MATKTTTKKNQSTSSEAAESKPELAAFGMNVAYIKDEDKNGNTYVFGFVRYKNNKQIKEIPVSLFASTPEEKVRLGELNIQPGDLVGFPAVEFIEGTWETQDGRRICKLRKGQERIAFAGLHVVSRKAVKVKTVETGEAPEGVTKALTGIRGLMSKLLGL